MDELTQLTHSLRAWLADAYDVWWLHGADHVRGGFHERLNHDLAATDEARRARLHPRQAFAYSEASRLRWTGPVALAVAHALRYFTAHYRREDGFYRALVSHNGEVIDDEILLYDQAFALLGFAAGYSALADQTWRGLAIDLHTVLRARLTHSRTGFRESFAPGPLSSNSQMHLLEASLAWMYIDDDPRWHGLAREMIELALTQLIDARTGALPETFGLEWQPEPGSPVEPGHQFEWAWLLLRFNRLLHEDRLERAALRLIDVGETFGVCHDRRVAVASLNEDLSVRNSHARLWSQCERVKAACSAFALTGAARYRSMALEAIATLRSYLDTPIRGLWRDRLDAEGLFVEEPAPASSLYHLVGAVLELSHVTEQLSPGRQPP